MIYSTRSGCRICNGSFKTILDLGMLYPSDFIKDSQDLKKAPLHLVQCNDCGLVQLKDTVNLDLMYRQYWYQSGLNNSMVKSLQDIVDSIESFNLLVPGDTVIDIGCNDGTMLSLYKTSNLYKIGVDPALNLAEEARKNCDFFVNDYFYAAAMQNHKAKVITAIAVFYDLEDPMRFLKEVKKVLLSDGLFVVQFMDLYSMISTNGFDNICHEHLEYYSLQIIERMFSSAGFAIGKVEYNDVNGGSIRVYATPKRCPNYGDPMYGFCPSLEENLLKEMEYFRTAEVYSNFRNEALDTKDVVKNYVNTFDGSVAAFGASTKGNTLLQYFDLDFTNIMHISEINKDKYGLYTVGTNIPIIPQSESLNKGVGIYLVLPWHFIDNFIEKLHHYLLSGGKLLVPLPKPAVVYSSEGEVKWKYLKKQ